MTAKDRMLTYLPPYYRESRVMNAIISAQGGEIDKYNEALNEILKQFFISTATWGISIWEEQYGLPTNESMDIQTRRQLVLAKKRSGRNSLLKMLQAVEPTIALVWGGLRLPFTIYSAEDIYNFGPLVVLLERHRPVHLGYIFQLLPDIQASGYTVHANHKTRSKVNLELKAGTVMTGRWPRWNSHGQTKETIAGVKAVSVEGNGFFDVAADLYSGPIRARSNVGVVLKINPGIRLEQVIGLCSFPVAVIQCGKTPGDSSMGTMQQTSVLASAQAITGIWPFPYAGVSVGVVGVSTIGFTDELKTGIWVFPYVGTSTVGTTPESTTNGAAQTFQLASSGSLVVGTCLFPVAAIQCGKTPGDTSTGTTQQASVQAQAQVTTGTWPFPYAGVSVGAVSVPAVGFAGEFKTGESRFLSCGPYHSGEEVA